MHGVTKKSRFLAIACGFIATLTIGNSVAQAQETVVRLYDGSQTMFRGNTAAHFRQYHHPLGAVDMLDAGPNLLEFSAPRKSESYDCPNLKDYERRPLAGWFPFKFGNWNDEAVEVWVAAGWTVELYTATRYGGKKEVLDGGDEGARYELKRFGLHEEVSSLKFYKTK